MEKEEAEKYNHIPTSEINKDVLDTQKEIDDLRDENEILNRNPVENKVRIYMNEGRIIKREKFIEKLNSILEHRE